MERPFVTQNLINSPVHKDSERVFEEPERVELNIGDVALNTGLLNDAVLLTADVLYLYLVGQGVVNIATNSQNRDGSGAPVREAPDSTKEVWRAVSSFKLSSGSTDKIELESLRFLYGLDDATFDDKRNAIFEEASKKNNGVVPIGVRQGMDVLVRCREQDMTLKECITDPNGFGLIHWEENARAAGVDLSKFDVKPGEAERSEKEIFEAMLKDTYKSIRRI